MKLVIATLSVINCALAILSFLPCMMAGLMSMDSPQAQNSFLSHVLCCLILSFPIVCLICGVAPEYINNKLSIYVALFPICEMTLFFATIYLISFLKGRS